MTKMKKDIIISGLARRAPGAGTDPEKKELRREAEGREPVMAGFGGTGVYRIPERCVGRGGTGGAFGVPCAPAMLPSGRA